MSTITKERAQQIYLCNGPEPTASEERELARIALASLEAEPVAWTDADELRDVKNGGNGYLFAIGGEANKFADPRRQVMLYTAPPAPVSVPDLKPVGFLFVSDDGAVAYSPADWPMKGFNLIGPIYGDVNACRAAMLTGDKN